MALTDETIRKHSSLILVVENTTRIGVEFEHICKNVLNPSIDYLSKSTTNDKATLSALKKQLYSVVTFGHSLSPYCNPVSASKIFSTPSDAKSALAKIQFQKLASLVESNRNTLRKVLVICQKLLKKMHLMRRSTDVVTNHLFLVLDSSFDDTNDIETEECIRNETTNENFSAILKLLKNEFRVSISVLTLSQVAFLPQLFSNVTRKVDIRISEKHYQTAEVILDGIEIPIITSESVNVGGSNKQKLPPSEDKSSEEPPRKVQVVSNVPTSAEILQPSHASGVPSSHASVVNTSQNSITGRAISSNALAVAETLNSHVSRPNVQIPPNLIAQGQGQIGMSTPQISHIQRPNIQSASNVSISNTSASSIHGQIVSTAQHQNAQAHSRYTHAHGQAQNMPQYQQQVPNNNPNTNQMRPNSTPQPQIVWSGLLKVKFSITSTNPQSITRMYAANFLVDPAISNSARPHDVDQWLTECQLQFFNSQVVQELLKFVGDSLHLPCVFYSKSDDPNRAGAANDKQEPIADDDLLNQYLNNKENSLFAFISLSSFGGPRQSDANRQRKMGMVAAGRNYPNSNYKGVAVIPNDQPAFTNALKICVNRIKQNQQQHQAQLQHMQQQQQQQQQNQQQNLQQASVSSGNLEMKVGGTAAGGGGNINVSMGNQNHSQLQQQQQQQQTMMTSASAVAPGNPVSGGGGSNNPAEQPLSQLANLANNPGLQNQMGKLVQQQQQQQNVAVSVHQSTQPHQAMGVGNQQVHMGQSTGGGNIMMKMKMVGAGGGNTGGGNPHHQQSMFVPNQHLQQQQQQQMSVISGNTSQGTHMMQSHQQQLQMQSQMRGGPQGSLQMSMNQQQQQPQGQPPGMGGGNYPHGVSQQQGMAGGPGGSGGGAVYMQGGMTQAQLQNMYGKTPAQQMALMQQLQHQKGPVGGGTAGSAQSMSQHGNPGMWNSSIPTSQPHQQGAPQIHSGAPGVYGQQRQQHAQQNIHMQQQTQQGNMNVPVSDPSSIYNPEFIN